MATTTNYGWPTPDDTDLVKDGAEAIRDLGSSIDSTTEDLNPATTEGDLQYRGATVDVNERLAIGTAGQVLAVNAGADAPEWVTPAGGGSNYSLLSTTNLSGSITTISGISGVDKIGIIVSNASTNSTSSDISVRFNTDTSNHNYAAATNNFSNPIFRGNVSTQYYGNVGNIILGQMAQASASLVNGGVFVTGCDSSGVKYIIASGSGEASSSGSEQTGYTSQGFYDSSSAITSVSIVTSTGTFDAGSVRIFTSA